MTVWWKRHPLDDNTRTTVTVFMGMSDGALVEPTGKVEQTIIDEMRKIDKDIVFLSADEPLRTGQLMCHVIVIATTADTEQVVREQWVQWLHGICEVEIKVLERA
jgi:hypothetical protein